MNTPSTSPLARWAPAILAGILVCYALLAGLYAVETPPWQVPDEPAHYNYVAYVAETGRLPELKPGDYPAEYLETLKAQRFRPGLSVNSIRYEAHQPPLYYLLAALVYRLFAAIAPGAVLLGLRLFSVALGAVSLILTYRLVRCLSPHDPSLALGVTAVSAFLPMHIAMTAAVNNDVLSDLLLVLIAWQLVRTRPSSWGTREVVSLGVSLGLALLTKMQSWVAFGLVAIALAWEVRDTWRSAERFHWVEAAILYAILVAIALAMALPWLVRNMAVYGLGDPLGLRRHDQVVVGQLTTRTLIAQVGAKGYLRALVQTTFQSFWGQFGWMGVVLHPRIYFALAIVTSLAGVGLLRWALDLWRRRRDLSSLARRQLLLMAAWIVLTTLGFIWWNLKYVQHQGRYLFPALTPLGLALVMGWREALRPPLHGSLGALGVAALALAFWGVTRGDLPGFSLLLLALAGGGVLVGAWIQRRLLGVVELGLAIGLAALALFSLYAYIVPQLTPL